eukprot:SAG31_NODE_31172_length_371_cov_0.845588_1_plen_56_part_10
MVIVLLVTEDGGFCSTFSPLLDPQHRQNLRIYEAPVRAPKKMRQEKPINDKYKTLH